MKSIGRAERCNTDSHTAPPAWEQASRAALRVRAVGVGAQNVTLWETEE